MSGVNKIFILLGVLFLLSGGAFAQASLDSVQLRNIKGKMVSYGAVTGQAPLVMVCFWSVNSEASIRELNAINVRYGKMKKPLPFALLAICVDGGNLLNLMRHTALDNIWTFDVYADINGDLQRAFDFTGAPQALIVNKGEVVYRQSGFQPGTEDYLFSKVMTLAADKQK